MNSEPVAGSVTPRLWTPPLTKLTPETSYGYDVIDFASEVLEIDLDPWQRWLVIHLGELLPDGRPRFRIVLILVARQNGKTLLARVLTLYWMFVESVALILGTHASNAYAKDSWQEVINMAETNPYLARDLGPKYAYYQVGQERFDTLSGSRYKFAAANKRAGRGLTVHRLIIDELREHPRWAAWDAAYNAMQAVHDAQVVTITNQGDDTAVVLNSFRKSALDYIETGEGDPRLGLFEWSAPNGADPTDPQALAMANPNLGDRIALDTLLGAGERAKRAGGEELAGFRTEVMCMRVHMFDAAIDENEWANCTVEDPIDLDEYRKRMALCLDVALDGSHASLIAAATVDDTIRIEVIREWSGHGCVGKVKRDLPGIMAKAKARRLGWFPNGPAAAITAELRQKRFAPRGTKVEEIKSDMPAVCMGLAEQVTSGAVAHAGDPMLTAHVTSAQKLHRGDTWVFTRSEDRAVDAAYATAGAVHLARMLPPPRPELTIV